MIRHCTFQPLKNPTQTQTVIRGLDVRRKLRRKRCVVEFVPDVREKDPLRLDLLHQLQHLAQAHVCGVRLVAQAADDERFQAVQVLQSFRRDALRVGAVRQIARAEAQDLHPAVVDRQREDFAPKDFKLAERLELVNDQFRDPPRWKLLDRRVENVRERLVDRPIRPLVAENFRRFVVVTARKEPCVVQPKEMVHVRVRVEDRVGIDQPLTKKLLTKIRARVDQKISFRETKDHGASRALVFRVGTLADGAVAADHGNAVGRAGSEKDEVPNRKFSNHVCKVQAVTQQITPTLRPFKRFGIGSY